jgi:hypothetical protein
MLSIQVLRRRIIQTVVLACLIWSIYSPLKVHLYRKRHNTLYVQVIYNLRIQKKTTKQTESKSMGKGPKFVLVR